MQSKSTPNPNPNASAQSTPTQAAVPPPATYANFLRVDSRGPEIYLTFGQSAQGTNAAHLVCSLVTVPAQAKAMLATLGEAVRRHEEQYGEIPAPRLRAVPEGQGS